MNLAAYLERIAYVGTPVADDVTLRDVHRLHATAIPFENLDIQLGLPIDLRPQCVEDKLVHRRRGGYCFEQNTLLLHVLRSIGFAAIGCEARVLEGTHAPTPRTHMVLVVRVGATEWLCDVGFGGDTPLEPVLLDGSRSVQGGVAYRVVGRGNHLVLQADVATGWIDQYVFAPEAREAIDFEVANWYTSTHPESPFVRKLTAQQRTPTGSKVLRNLQWTRRHQGVTETREVARAELEPLLAAEFGLQLPAGVRFRALDGT